MSRIISPLTVAAGDNNLLGTGPTSDLSIVRSAIIANISPYVLYVTGVDTERYLNPMEVDRFTCVDGLAFLKGYATQIFTSSSFPANSCLVTLIYDGDPDPGGSYPFSLGAGSVSVTQPTQVLNDGFPLSTIVVEATPLGALSGGAQSYILIKNDGTMQVWCNSAGTLTKMVSVAPGNNSTAATATIDHASKADALMDVYSVSPPHIQMSIGDTGSAFTVYFTPVAPPSTGLPIQWGYLTAGGAGAYALQFNTDGSVEVLVGALKIDNGPVNFRYGGSISGQQTVTGSGNGTFSHSLGVSPAIVLLEVTSGGASIHQVGSYTTSGFTVAGLSGSQSWKALVLV